MISLVNKRKRRFYYFKGDSFSNLTWIVAYHTKYFHCENFAIYIKKIFAPKIYSLSIFFVRAIFRERCPLYLITQTYSFGKFGKFNGFGDFDRFYSFKQRLSVLLNRDNVAMLGSRTHPPTLPPAIDCEIEVVNKK